ncbi:MAG: pilus assembly protein [Deltaproteobacteria bacterium]|nr:pilus assembly protein [Deltaproteobacteria bacterium]
METTDRTSRRGRGERGMAAVEFALMMPVFLMMLAGIADFGRAFTIRQTLASAAHEAVRVGSVRGCPRPTADAIAYRATQTLADSGLDPANAVVQVTRTGDEAGDLLTVKVEYPTEFSFLASVAPLLATADAAQADAFSGSWSLSASLVSELQ